MAKKVPAGRVLEEWTERDLTAAAASGDLAPAFEFDDLVVRASDALASGRSLLIAGESGIGKTALVCELVRRAHAGVGPPALAGRRVLQLSFRHRAAMLRKEDDLRPEMQRLVEALQDTDGEVVPFFRDFHLAYRFDLEPQVQSLAYRLSGPVLGEASNVAMLASLLEYTPELEQQYVTLMLEEPSLARARSILAAWAADAPRRNGQRFTDAALDEAIHLSHRFLARNRLPRKALDLLVQVASLSDGHQVIDGIDVIDRFSTVHHVPRALIDPAEALDLASVKKRLAHELLGQDEAVTVVSRTIGLIKSGLSDARRPFGVFLFVGPTGVGKTHAAQLLAHYLFGSRDRMIRLNMTDHQAPASPDVLFGDPFGNALAQRRGSVTQRIAGYPFAVLLLDEFEKAHEKVADRFLQLFDEGSFINGNGETISCRSMIIIATSNVGAELHRGLPLGFLSTASSASASERKRLTHDLDRRLAQRFRIELLNRFDQVVQFQPLSRPDVRLIAARELQSLKDRIGFKRSGLELEVDEAVLDWLAVHGYDPRFGARFLRRTLEREVTSTLAGLLVHGKSTDGARALLTVRRNRIEATLIPRDPTASASPAVARREAVTLPRGTVTDTRTLDREALGQVARDLLREAADLLTHLDAKRDEAGQLLTMMNAPGFWEHGADSRETLDRYRSIDVTIQVEARFAGVLRDLETLMQDAIASRDVPRLARQVERAAHALRQWQDRLLEEGARDVWLSIERTDSLQTESAASWLTELAQMQLAWCQRLHLEASIAACEFVDGELVRILLQVEGPGAAAYLAVEQGLHRRTRKVGAPLKARVEIVPRGENAAPPSPVEVARIKDRAGPLGLTLSCAGRIQIGRSGLSVELMGSDAEIIAAALADLSAHRTQEPGDRSAVARIYGQDGVGARDPRTGAKVLRLKDVLKGELDVFLDAWRRHAPEAETQGQTQAQPV
jgi:ATP-dependent Clp protease ATP-binding subunit ClpA/protein subunit release factor A